MFTENHPKQKQTFFAGAEYDSDPFLIFSKEASGSYVDAHNMEVSINDGDAGRIKKIKGAALVYGNTTNLTGYRCVGSITINEYAVEIWAPLNPSFASIIRINGVIALSSTNFNINVDNECQLSKNESALNELFIANKPNVPYVFDVKDMYDSYVANSQKYFTAFERKLYQVNIQSALDMPVFVGLKNVGGGGGAPVGQYQYQMRFSSNSGDKTNWSHPTPMIPVMQSLSSDSREYPFARTFGGPPNPSSVTSLAPVLRFRVTNLYNYDFIEIKRIPYNNGAGITYTPLGTVVYKTAIAPGEISVREYVDFQESNSNVAVSEQDDVRQLAHVKTAGSIRYYDRRIVLADIEVESKIADVDFVQINEQTGFPVIDNIGKAGYNDPWNMVYRKSEMRGEKAGFGVNFYDCVGNSGFVTKITDLENFEFPNRRDPASADTILYSFSGVVRAATTEVGEVDETHEVFDLSEAVSKTNKCDFKNVIEKGRVFGATGTKVKTPYGVNQDCDETNAEIENHGANVSAIGSLVSTSYQPYHPVGKGDSDVSGHNYMTNNKVATEDIFVASFPVEDSNVKQYSPKGFGPSMFSMGMIVAGVTNIPEWVKSFAVVRTPSAGRVVCQGIGFYSLIKARFNLIGNDNLGGKGSKNLWFYSPDVDHGIVSSSVLNDIIDNPANYKLQFVSPLGFFSEWYSAEDNLIEKQRDRCVDMISYVRMLRDKASDPEINPGESAGMGIDGGDGYRYIDYQLWRNTGAATTAFSGTAEKGNRYFDINAVSRKAEGRGNYLEIEAGSDFYQTVYPGDVTETNFGDAGAKNWTEPVYVVNIIRTGADINDNEIKSYKPTSHYQKIESIIGKSNGQAGQVFKLVDERWEDCIPAPKSTYNGASTPRYLYVKDANGVVKKWLNVTYLPTATVKAIVADIKNQGAYNSDIYGVYTHTNVNDEDRFFEINFNVGLHAAACIPPVDSFIMVRYDSSAPIRVFGGDTYIGEAIFAPIDRQSSARDDAAETQFAFGNSLPYKTFKINPRHYTIKKSGAAANAVQDREWFTLGYIRQLCVMFTVESRAAVHLAHNLDSPNQYFPLTHYVIRPNRWDVTKSIVDNHLFEDYQNDYGADELNQWKWGGFRFLQQVNPDYSIDAPVIFKSKPEFGFVEQTLFPNMTMWTLPRPTNVANAPGLKTFPANNAYIIDDSTGAIKYLWADTSEKGDNLYAITETGIFTLLTKKNILSDVNGDTVGYMATTDSFISKDVPLTRSIGVPSNMWKTITEGIVPSTSESGAEEIIDALFFANKQSIYRLMGNSVVDILRTNYYSKVKPQLDLITSSTRMAGVFDFYKKQYMVTIVNSDINQAVTFSYNQKLDRWMGSNSYYFDKYTSFGNKLYGHKDMKTFELGSGYQIDGANIDAFAITCHAPEGTLNKEFIRLRLNSSVKPTKVEFLKTKTGVSQCDLLASDLKDYKGYECVIPRTKSSVDINTPRFQEGLIFTKISHNLAEDFTIIDAEMQYKLIKT